jgi:IMP dehydrogenase
MKFQKEMMNKFKKNTALCFDDILLVPQHSDIDSRRSVDLKMNIGKNLSLSLPVIAAPMDTVCEIKMAIELYKAGGIGIIHRFMPIEDQVSQIRSSVSDHGVKNIGGSIGAKGDYVSDALRLEEAGATVILVDTANGHSSYAIDAVKTLRSVLKTSTHIMAGNVATGEGYKALSEAGADSVRVGIGGGGVCVTRLVSGHGVPLLSSVMDCKKVKEKYSLNTAIIADGGIRNSGDMIKAFAGGADAVMVGSILAGTEESPGSTFINSTGKYKTYRGMASSEANKGKDIAVAEGVSTLIPFKGSVSEVLKDIKGGLGSGCSYSGVTKLLDIYENAMYVEVSQASLGESKPHASGLNV